MKKITILLAILFLSSVHLYSKNYKRLILGEWQSKRFKWMKFIFKANNKLNGIILKRKIVGTWKIEDNYLLLKFGKKKETNIYIIKNITKSVMHILSFKTYKSKISKLKQQVTYNEFFLRTK